MSEGWQQVPLARVMAQRKHFIEIDDTQTYKRCRVQLHAKGIELRDVVTGGEVKTKRQQVCRAGEFLVAEIDAKVGGFGIVPETLEDAIVSSHYFLFELNDAVLDRRFLDYYSRTPAFREQVSAQGTTNYAAIRSNNVLGYTIPLPPLPEQRRIVARIEELAAKIKEAKGLRRQAVEEVSAFLSAFAYRILDGVAAKPTQLREWLSLDREGIQTGPFGAQLSAGDFQNKGVPVLTIGNIQYDGLDIRAIKRVSEEKARQLNRYSLEEGDILFARMGTVGRCCVVPKASNGWLINYHIIRVALDASRVAPRYVHWTLRASADVVNYLSGKIRGATRRGVNSAIVGALPIRVPSLPEQHSILNQLDATQAKVDALKQLQAETAAELAALLPSVLDRAFSGRL